MKLSLTEIRNWKEFEALAHAYFIKEKELKRYTEIVHIEITKSGIGADEGRDILLDFIVTDGIKEFNRKWVVQCKFYKDDISPTHLSDNNIPTLIHSYKANGYLLICKKEPTAKLTKLFERLNKECIFSYTYQIWGGEQFCMNIETQNDKAILKKFFTKYFNYLKKIDKQ